MNLNEIEQIIDRQRCRMFVDFMHLRSTCHNNHNNCWRNAVKIEEVRSILEQASEIVAPEGSNEGK